MSDIYPESVTQEMIDRWVEIESTAHIISTRATLNLITKSDYFVPSEAILWLRTALQTINVKPLEATMIYCVKKNELRSILCITCCNPKCNSVKVREITND